MSSEICLLPTFFFVASSVGTMNVIHEAWPLAGPERNRARRYLIGAAACARLPHALSRLRKRHDVTCSRTQNVAVAPNCLHSLPGAVHLLVLHG